MTTVKPGPHLNTTTVQRWK